MAQRKGYKQTEEHKNNLRIAMLKNGNKPPGFNRTGLKDSKETIEKKRLAHLGKTVGPQNGMWKGGITPINIKIRNSIEYKLWRESVFKRDDWTCVWCKTRGGIIHADHIKPFCDYPELRFAIDNGRTLCKTCHMTTETWGGRSNK